MQDHLDNVIRGLVEDAKSEDIAAAVHGQLSEDYEDSIISWVLDDKCEWSGPSTVRLSQIAFSNRENWQASHDPAHVDTMRQKILKGQQKPIILGKVAGAKKLIVLDGHHRSLAYKEIGKSAKAYVVSIPPDQVEAAHQMHSLQRDATFGSNQKK